jgi:flavin-binding protein dodecin
LFNVLITPKGKEEQMSDSVYKVIELVGSSSTSWEDAAKNAIARAGKSLRDLRVAEVSKLDMKVEDGKITAFRTKVSLSFKFEGE